MINAKTIITISTLLLTAGMTITSCKDKKENSDEDIVVEKFVEKPQQGTITMSKTDDGKDVQWVGSTYHYTISRHAMDSTEVENTGKKYHDNCIDLAVTRADGSVFFSRTLYKSSFSGLLSDDMREHGVLCSLAFDKADADNLYFVANIGSPEEANEDFVLLQFIVNRMGTTQVATYEPAMQE